MTKQERTFHVEESNGRIQTYWRYPSFHWFASREEAAQFGSFQTDGPCSVLIQAKYLGLPVVFDVVSDCGMIIPADWFTE